MAIDRDRYHIRLDVIYKTIGIEGKRIPLGHKGVWYDKTITSGYSRDKTLFLPKIILEPKGIANRIKVQCPSCGKIVRFSCLKQHISTKNCDNIAAKRVISLK